MLDQADVLSLLVKREGTSLPLHKWVNNKELIDQQFDKNHA
jgi:hypothetical protein